MGTIIFTIEKLKKRFFGYGGKSEFYGHTLTEQSAKIKKGLDIFKSHDINIRTFFSPNHTYDLNTFEALKLSGIKEVIDGYGLKPYIENNIKFIPQLFYKPIFLPFGLQTTQIHLNYWTEKEFDKFAILVNENFDKIVSYDEALKLISNKNTDILLNHIIKNILILKEKFFKF